MKRQWTYGPTFNINIAMDLSISCSNVEIGNENKSQKGNRFGQEKDY